MKKLILILTFLAWNCSNAIGLDLTQLQGVSVDTSAIVDLISPKNEALIAGLTPGEALAVVAVLNEGEEEEPSEPTWQPEARWIYMFGADGLVINDNGFEYQEYVPETDPFELRLRMYIAQMNNMNKPVQDGGDARCPCTVYHGGPGSGI